MLKSMLSFEQNIITDANRSQMCLDGGSTKLAEAEVDEDYKKNTAWSSSTAAGTKYSSTPPCFDSTVDTTLAPVVEEKSEVEESPRSWSSRCMRRSRLSLCILFSF